MSGRYGCSPAEYEQLLRDAATYSDGSMRPITQAASRLDRALRTSGKPWAEPMLTDARFTGHRERIRNWKRRANTTTTRRGERTATLPGTVAVRRRDDAGNVYWQSIPWEQCRMADLHQVILSEDGHAGAHALMADTGRALVKLLAEHRTVEYVQEALNIEGVTLDEYLIQSGAA